MEKNVILGLSGGVDSFVSALLLKEQGFRVIACTFKMLNNEESIENARKLAQVLDVEFKVIDIMKPFKKQIVDPFINAYFSGETPNPCVWCNNEIKVYFLYQAMIEYNADFFATGHYIKIKKFENQFFIYKGVDPDKDQSYFLWNVRSEYLKNWLTPLGPYLKKEIKQIAIDHKMGHLAHKKESMGVCFLGDSSYQQFLQDNKSPSVKIEPGHVLDKNNNVIGKHNGTSFYTIGQKKGFEVEGKGLAVTEINSKENTLTVGGPEELYVLKFKVRNYYFFNQDDLKLSQISVIVRGLGRNPKGFCKLKIIDELNIEVVLEHEAWAVAKGQPVAFYIGGRIIGGAYV